MPRKIASLVLILVILGAGCVGVQASPQVETPGPQAVKSTASPVPSQEGLPSPQPTDATPGPLTLTPTSGGPGTVVQIHGFVPGGPTQAAAQGNETDLHANVCWGGCLDGLLLQGQTVSWSDTQPGHFTIQFTVPSTPWLGAGGPQPLTSGDIPVGVQCLPPVEKGCALHESSLQASFHLNGVPNGRCQGTADCSQMSLSPTQGAPGEEIQVQGWAPLVTVIGEIPFGYTLMLAPPDNQQNAVSIGDVQQALDGSFTASFLVPQQIPGSGPLRAGTYRVSLYAMHGSDSQQVEVASTDFTVKGGLAWDTLHLNKPIWIQPSASPLDPEVAFDVTDKQRMAYCAPGSIRLTSDGGQTWTAISTADAAQVASQGNYPLFGQGEQPACVAVTLDSNHASSFYAVFQTAKKDMGAPPIYFMGYFTTDGGQTWKSVPVPSPALQENFGGFWTDGKVVEALYASQDQQPDQAPSPQVEQTTDGGATWAPAALLCPTEGPCLRWGPAGGMIGGMGSPLPQWVMRSPDGGKTWLSTGHSVELRATGPDELVAFSPQEAALISGAADYPLLFTQDAGQTWQALSLPTPPGPQTGYLYEGLQMLADGTLLIRSTDSSTWMMLLPGANAWCRLGAVGLPEISLLLEPAGGRLWWVPVIDANQPSASQIQSVPVSSLKCAP